MRMPSLVALACLQAGPERPRHQDNCWSKSLQQYTLTDTLAYFAIDLRVWRAGPLQDTTKRTTQDLTQSSGRGHANFGGSRLPKGRARATKATAGLRGLQQFTLAISHLLGGRSCQCCTGPLQDTIKQTTAPRSPIFWPWACQDWWLQLACRPR